MQRIPFNEITGLEIIWLGFLDDSHGEIVIRISPVIGSLRATVLLIQEHFRTPLFFRLLRDVIGPAITAYLARSKTLDATAGSLERKNFFFHLLRRHGNRL